MTTLAKFTDGIVSDKFRQRAQAFLIAMTGCGTFAATFAVDWLKAACSSADGTAWDVFWRAPLVLAAVVVIVALLPLAPDLSPRGRATSPASAGQPLPLPFHLSGLAEGVEKRTFPSRPTGAE